jgi:lysophospholipase L1-like esterase
MDQVSCVSPAYGTVTAVKLVYAAFDMPQQGEADRPVTATGTASVYVPGANAVTVIANGSVSSGATALNFVSTTLGANGISAGQLISSGGGGIAAGTYVVGVGNSFSAGAGNLPSGTVVTLSSGTTATTAAGQQFTFSGLFAPVRFGGRRQFTIEPGHDVVTSDAVSVELQPGTQFFVRTAASFSGPGLQLMDYPGTGSRQAGEFDNRGTTANDQTLTPVTLANAGGGYWCPVAVLGLVSLPPGASAPGTVLILGDSIAAGTGDTADALGLQGYIQRSLENNLPFVTSARGSTTAFGLMSHGDGQYALSVDTGITDVLLEDGRNDILSFSLTDSALEAVIRSVAVRYVAAGKRVWCFTVPPTTQSNDGWTTLANQSWTVAVATVGAAGAAAGAVSVPLQSIANLAVGQAVAGSGIAPATVVTSISAATGVIGLSVPTSAALPAAAKLSFGSGAGMDPAEGYRRSYNNFLRQKSAQLGCTGVIDIDQVVADPQGSGKWRVDFGSASADGVHPSAALHQAAVNARVITPSMFTAQ